MVRQSHGCLKCGSTHPSAGLPRHPYCVPAVSWRAAKCFKQEKNRGYRGCSRIRENSAASIDRRMVQSPHERSTPDLSVDHHGCRRVPGAVRCLLWTGVLDFRADELSWWESIEGGSIAFGTFISCSVGEPDDGLSHERGIDPSMSRREDSPGLD